jgi:hypothetical protein
MPARSRRGVAPLLLLLIAGACVPAHSSYVGFPLASVHQRDLLCAEIDVPIADLLARQPELDLDRLAIYAQGREPLPFVRVDVDQDGAADSIRTWAPVRGDGTTRLQFVSPGPNATKPVPPEPVRGEVEVRFDLSWR